MNMNTFRSPQSQSGQIVVLLIISLLTMMFTVGLIFNTGQQIHWKTQTQNAIDSGAISHGTNVARALNVMSANNVAITQAFTLNVLMANLVPELTASTITATIVLPIYIADAISWCAQAASNPFNIAAGIYCARNTAAAERTIDILGELDDIWDQIGSRFNPSKVGDAAAAVQALESMNTQLYTNFSNSAANMVTRLGYENNLDEAPVFIGGGAFFANKEADLTSPNYNATWLPIEKTTTIESGTPPVVGGSIDGSAQDLSLCITGYKGTPIAGTPTGNLKPFANFEAHGYPIGEGPYPIGRDEFNDTIERQVDRLEDMRERIPGGSRIDIPDITDFKNLVEVAYPLMCSLQRVMGIAGGSIINFPFPDERFTLYKASEPVLDTTNTENHNWGIFAIARKEQATGFVGGGLFQNPIKAHYAYAQVEVYNPVWYDLYTQDWTVKLQPASFVVDLHPDFVNTIATFFPEIEPALRRGILKYNNH